MRNRANTSSNIATSFLQAAHMGLNLEGVTMGLIDHAFSVLDGPV